MKFFLLITMLTFLNCAYYSTEDKKVALANPEEDISEQTISEVYSQEIIGLWSVEAVKLGKKKMQVKAFYFFGADSTFMFSADSTVKNNLIEGYKYFLRNDTIYTLYAQGESKFIYKDETKIIIFFKDDEMQFKSLKGEISYLRRLNR